MVTLLDGSVLLAGGGEPEYFVTRSAEVFNPRLETWSNAGPMGTARTYPLGVRLLDGRVLVAGGENYCEPFPLGCHPHYNSSAEIFTPE
jgi:hypothetical protein